MLNRLCGRAQTQGDERAGTGRWVRHLFIVGGILSGVFQPLQADGTMSIATAEEVMTGPATTTGRIVFNITSQPLATALRAYSAVARVAVLVDGELTAGRYSAEVIGAFSQEGALRSLLAGTGLTVRYATPAAFTLVPAPTDPLRNNRDYSHYFLAVQTALKRVLCQNEETRPGRYRMALQLWIDQSGTVARSEFLSPTGSSERDAMIFDGLRSIIIEMPQPVGLPQPVTVVVAPRASGQDAECVRRVTGSQR